MNARLQALADKEELGAPEKNPATAPTHEPLSRTVILDAKCLYIRCRRRRPCCVAFLFSRWDRLAMARDRETNESSALKYL